MAVNGKQKGNAWERKVANLFSEKFAAFLNKDKAFIRNIDSGSYFGGKNQNRIKTHLEEHQSFGDILTPSNFRFEIECKAYKTAPSLDLILKGSIKLFDEWIEQSEQDAQNGNKEPMLVIKFNNTVPFVMVQCDIDFIESTFQYRGYSAYPLKLVLEKVDEAWFFTD